MIRLPENDKPYIDATIRINFEISEIILLKHKNSELEKWIQSKFHANQSTVSVEELLENKNSVLTVNILRSWDREKIEKFALHLLGDQWQGKSVECDARVELTEEGKKEAEND